MSKQRIQAWIDALKSGEFKHGPKCLRRVVSGVDHFCCLGVACELYRRATGDGYWQVATGVAVPNVIEFVVENTTAATALPSVVSRWLELETINLASMIYVSWYVPGSKTLESLVRLNDIATDYSAVIEAIECVILPAVEAVESSVAEPSQGKPPREVAP